MDERNERRGEGRGGGGVGSHSDGVLCRIKGACIVLYEEIIVHITFLKYISKKRNLRYVTFACGLALIKRHTQQPCKDVCMCIYLLHQHGQFVRVAYEA